VVECVGKSYSICNEIIRVLSDLEVKAKVGRKYVYIEFNDVRVRFSLRPRDKLEVILNKVKELLNVIEEVDLYGDLPKIFSNEGGG